MANHWRIIVLATIAVAGLLLAYSFTLIKQALEDKANLTIKRHFEGTSLEVTVYESSGKKPGPTLLVFEGTERVSYLVCPL